LFGTAPEHLLTRDRRVVAVCLAALCLLAWLYLVHLASQMDGMTETTGGMMEMPAGDDMSGVVGAAMRSDAGRLADATVNFALLALMWGVMMVGMMLPSAAPTILLFAALERKRAGGEIGGRIALFIGGYLAVWSLFAVVAAAAQTMLAHADLVSARMVATSTLLSGGILVAAGIYEFTSLKDRCLTHCRSPLEWIPRNLRPGRGGAFRMGVGHGAYCVGCCWLLMLLLFVGGVMNLVWVALIAIVVLGQKIMPGRPILARVTGAVLVLGGVVLLARPLLAA
jgi:predicted metal-binding membrane protein